MGSPDADDGAELRANVLTLQQTADWAPRERRANSPGDDCDAIQAEIYQGQMIVLEALRETKMAYSRDEERSLISSFNKEQRKYGSTSTYVKQPERYISYEVQDGDTLQGIALKHDVTMEQLKRANKLWTNDSLHVRRTLLVPVPLEPCGASLDSVTSCGVMLCSRSTDSLHSAGSGSGSASGCDRLSNGGPEPPAPASRADLSAADFLKNVDSVIASSRRSVKKLESHQPPAGEDEDVLYNRSARQRLRGDLLVSDPNALPLTAVRSPGRPRHARPVAPVGTEEVFEL